MGPLLFLLHINDITSCVKFSHLDLYADDIRMYKKILSPNDCISLQTDIDRIVQWPVNNNIDLHSGKYRIMSVGRGDSLFEHNYCIGGKILSRVQVIRGILFDSNWSCISHINFIISKALKLLGFIKRTTFSFKSCLTVTCLYKSLVLPQLLYGSVIWSPYMDDEFSKLESIPKKFLRYASSKTNSIMNIYDHDYNVISQYCNIYTIESHHVTNDLIFVNKVLKNNCS